MKALHFPSPEFVNPRYNIAQLVNHLPAMQDLGSIPGSGRSPGERNGYPLQYSCLENPMDRGA